MTRDRRSAELEARLQIQLDPALLERALTHRSYAYENGGLPTNERLEFLGDAVLGLVVTDTLYRAHPELPEGQLAKLRSAVVNARALADVGRELDLGSHVRLGRGEETTGGRDKSSILADTVEALIGAQLDLAVAFAALDAFLQPVHQHFYCFRVVRGRHRAGEAFGFGRAFHYKRGLRQPDPLDPAL